MRLFLQNTYLLHFLEGHLSPLHSRLAQESRMFRKPCQIHVSSTFVEKSSLLSVIRFPSLVLNYAYIHDAFCF